MAVRGVRFVALIAVSLLVGSGCTAQSARNVRNGGLALTVGGGTAGVAAGVVAVVATEPYLWQSTLVLGSAVLLTGALLLAGGHLAVRSHAGDPAPGAPPPSPDAGARLARRTQAWELTRAAEAAAIGRDCTRVATLSQQVATLDTDLHTVVFSRNAAIARCRPPAP